MLKTPFFRTIDDQLPLRLTPGPFEVSPGVLAAASEAFAGHRTPFFRRMASEIVSMLHRAYHNPALSEYETVLITGSGSAGMEAMVAAMAPTGKPLVLVNGRFSRRLADMVVLYNPDATVLDFGAGEVIDVGRVAEAVERRRHELLVFALQDTREAILNPFRELCSLATKHEMRVVLDAISAGIIEDFDPKQLGVDIFCDSSGKGARGLPGLATVTAKREVWESLDRRQIRAYYLNLAAHYESHSRGGEPLFAPATAVYSALHRALTELHEQSVESRRSEIRRRAETVRADINATPLRPFGQMPISITSYLLPSGLTFRSFQDALAAQGILVYSGSSVVEDCFQIGTAGYLSDDILEEAIEIINSTLAGLTPR